MCTFMSLTPQLQQLGWSMYSDPQGRPYYYNASTTENTYDYPGAPRALGTTSDTENAWIEYLDESSKKPYYYNTLTKETVWDEPEAIRVKKAREQAKALGLSVEQPNQPKPEEDHDEEDLEEDEDEKKKTLDENPEVDYSTWSKKDLVIEFKQNLKDCDITSKMKWTEVLEKMKDIQQSKKKSKSKTMSRWNCLSTIGEKKQAFAEYQTQQSKQERLEQRLRAKAAREDFMKLLAGCAAITSTMYWEEAKDLIHEDPRYDAISDERDRKDMFHDFLKELERNEQEFREKERRLWRLEFYTLCLEHCSVSWLEGLLLVVVQEPTPSDEDDRRFEQQHMDPKAYLTTVVKTKDMLNLALARAKEKREGQQQEQHRDTIISCATSSRLSSSAHLRECLVTDDRGKRLDERDLSRWFEDFVYDLRDYEKLQEKQKLRTYERQAHAHMSGYEACLSKCIDLGILTPSSRWRETIVALEKINDRADQVVETQEEENRSSSESSISKENPSSSGSSTNIVENEFLEWVEKFRSIEHEHVARDVFERQMKHLYETYHTLRHEVRRLKFPFTSTSVLTELITFINNAQDDSDRSVFDFSKYIDGSNNHKSSSSSLLLEQVFDEIKVIEIERRVAEELKIQQEMVDFVDLLTEYYYRSDHIDVQYREACEKLRKRSAFQRLDPELREKIFTGYMEKLNQKMHEGVKPRKEEDDEQPSPLVKTKPKKKRSHSRTARSRRSRKRKSSRHESGRSSSESSQDDDSSHDDDESEVGETKAESEAEEGEILDEDLAKRRDRKKKSKHSSRKSSKKKSKHRRHRSTSRRKKAKE